jgi:hypothetical protein
MAKKVPFPPDSPKHCPCAHKHISWSIGDDYVFCWDCNRKYSFSECFGSRTAISLDSSPKEQLTFFEQDAEPKDSSINEPEKEPNG